MSIRESLVKLNEARETFEFNLAAIKSDGHIGDRDAFVTYSSIKLLFKSQRRFGGLHLKVNKGVISIPLKLKFDL